MGTVVVTGVTGKLGSKVMEELKETIPFFRENFKEDSKKLKDAEIIIHIAGCIHGKTNKDYLDGNVETTKFLLKHAPNLKRFIYISTAIEGGMYSDTKRIAENMVKDSKVPYIILRPSVIVFDKDDRFLNQLFKLVKQFPVVPALGGGKNLMQPVFYKDVIKCIKKSITISPNQIIYVVGKDVLCFKEIVKLMARRLDKKVLVLPLPKFFIYFVPFLTSQEKERFFDKKIYPNKKMIEKLGVEPTSFEDMLKEVQV